MPDLSGTMRKCRIGTAKNFTLLLLLYITQPKDEVFALLKKNVKITKERIPAATQLFTPDWIVRYMVENSLGRLWVEGHPNAALKAGWKYYLEEAEQEPDVQAQLAKLREDYARLNPEDIKVIDIKTPRLIQFNFSSADFAA